MALVVNNKRLSYGFIKDKKLKKIYLGNRIIWELRLNQDNLDFALVQKYKDELNFETQWEDIIKLPDNTPDGVGFKFETIDNLQGHTGGIAGRGNAEITDDNITLTRRTIYDFTFEMTVKIFKGNVSDTKRFKVYVMRAWAPGNRETKFEAIQ